MSDLTQPDHQNGAEPTTLPEVKAIPEKKSVEPKVMPPKAVEAKAASPIPAKGGGAGGAPKKPAKSDNGQYWSAAVAMQARRNLQDLGVSGVRRLRGFWASPHLSKVLVHATTPIR